MPTADPTPTARLRVLGSTELTDAAGRSVDVILAQPKRLALLAYLRIARPGGFRRREQLLALFWPELDERRARSALSQALHRIRQALGPGVLLARGPDEVAVDPAALACDLGALDDALAEGRIDEALALYRGEVLPALSVVDAAEFQAWLDAERRAVCDRVVAAVHAAVDCADREGRLEDAVRLSRRLLELAPFDEPAVRRTMRLLARSGDHAGAVRCHDAFAERLRRELELAPGPETAALLGELRASRPAPPAPAPAAKESLSPSPAPPVVTAHVAPSAVSRRRASRPGRAAWAALVGVTAALMLLAWWRMRPRADAAAPEAHRVLVLPFTVRGDSSLAYLGDGMVELLSASLEGLAAVRAVDPHAVLAATTAADSVARTPDAAAVMTRRLGAEAFVLGDVIAMGDRLEVVGVLYDADGRRAGTLTARVPTIAQLPAAIDDLARQLVATRLSTPAERLARLATLTTDSLDALRAYLTGEADQRHGRFDAAVDDFRRAVQVDSLFALAWFRLGVALEWVQPSSPERRAALDRAMALGARLSERDRMLVRATLAYSYGSLDEAEALYRQLVTAYPEDVEAWYGLAEVLFHGGPFRGRPMQQAEPAFRRLLALHPRHLEGRLHLMRLLGRRDGAVDLAEIDSLEEGTRALVESQPVLLLRTAAFRAFVHGDTAAMRDAEVATDGLPENVAWEVGAGLATMTGNLAGAEAIFRRLALPAHPVQWRAIAHMALANLAVAAGRWSAAREELAAVTRLDRTLALFAHASLASAPWLPLDATERDSVRRALEAWRPGAPGPALVGSLPMHADLLPPVRLLDLAVLGALVGDTAASASAEQSLRESGPLASPIPSTWELGVTARAAVAQAGGRAAAALVAVEGARAASQLTSYPRAFIVTHGLERWARAEALRASGRLREALDWYGTFTCYLCLTDAPYEAPAWLRRGEIHEELGEREAAHAAYGLVLARWREADARFEPMLARARDGLTRTARPR